MRIVLVVLVLLLSPRAALAAQLEEIFNYHPIDADLATAGQVTPEQVPAVAAAGVDLIVNLAIADPERNAQEGFLVTQAGIAYTHIPVDWEAPSFEDLQFFFAVMDARGERRTLVHCFANFRASAFTYLYRTLREGIPEAEARADLEMIWTEEAWAEYPQWVTFIEEARRRYGQAATR